MSKRKSKVKANSKLTAAKRTDIAITANDLKVTDLSWLFYLASGIVFVTFLLLRFKFMDIPLDRDEGSYLYQGWALLQGQVPYVDFYEMKPPGLFFVYGIFHLLFGSSGYLLHLGLLLMIMHMAYMIYSISCKLDFDRTVGITAALIWCVLTLNFVTNAYGLMSEYFLVWAILLSAQLTLNYSKNENGYWLFVGGLILGLAAMIRQHAIFLAPIFPLILYFIGKPNMSAAVKRFVIFTGGALLTIGIFIGIILIYGSWDEMLYWVIERPNNSYTGSRVWADGQALLANMIRRISGLTPGPIFGGFVGFVAIFLLKVQWWKKLIVLLLVIGGLVSVVPGYRFYGHYWILTFWGWAMLCGAVVGILGQYVKSKKVATIFQALVVLLFGLSHLVTNSNTFIDVPGRQIVNFIYGENPQEAVDVLSKYADRKMKDTDEFYVYGSEPQAYYNTRKIDKSKHVFVGFIQKPGAVNSQYQQDVIKHIQTQKPKYILHIQNAFSHGFKEESDQSLYSWIYRYEQSNYKKIAVADIANYRNIKYVYDRNAQSYEPKTDNYVILYERKY